MRFHSRAAFTWSRVGCNCTAAWHQSGTKAPKVFCAAVTVLGELCPPPSSSPGLYAKPLQKPISPSQHSPARPASVVGAAICSPSEQGRGQPCHLQPSLALLGSVQPALPAPQPELKLCAAGRAAWAAVEDAAMALTWSSTSTGLGRGSAGRTGAADPAIISLHYAVRLVPSFPRAQKAAALSVLSPWLAAASAPHPAPRVVLSRISYPPPHQTGSTSSLDKPRATADQQTWSHHISGSPLSSFRVGASPA